MISNRIVQKNSGNPPVNNVLWGWGLNSNGVIDKNNVGSPFSYPVSTDKTPIFRQISHGAGFACGRDTNSDLWCWGSNSYGQLGDGSTTSSSNPILVFTGVSFVSCGRHHVMALTNTNYIFTWGRNNYGQLGTNNTTNYSFPFKISNNSYIKISAGEFHSLAIEKTSSYYGYLRAWGKNLRGQLGDGTINDRSTPQKIGSYYWSEISAGGNHSLGIRYNVNGFYGWGRNVNGQLGIGNTTDYSSPVLIVNPINALIQRVYARGNTSAIIYNSTLYTFGANNSGQLGNSNTTDQSIAVQVGPASYIAKFGMAGNDNYISSFFINQNYELYSCGSGSNYRTGQGTTSNSSTFTQVGSYTNWHQLSTGGESAPFMLAIRY